METRRLQLSFAEGFIAEETSDLWEPWMRHADAVPNDEALLTTVYEALVKPHPKNRTRGRLGKPAEVVKRPMLLQHIRDGSYGVAEREVRANPVYREFARVGGGKVPDAKTIGQWGLALGPAVIQDLQTRVVAIAQQREGRGPQDARGHHRGGGQDPLPHCQQFVRRRRTRSDPMKRITGIAGAVGSKLRDRGRSVKWRIREIGRAARSKGEPGKEKKLLSSVSRVVGQAKRFSQEIAAEVKRSSDVKQQAAREGLRREMDTMAPRGKQVITRTKGRALGGDTQGV